MYKLIHNFGKGNPVFEKKNYFSFFGLQNPFSRINY